MMWRNTAQVRQVSSANRPATRRQDARRTFTLAPVHTGVDRCTIARIITTGWEPAQRPALSRQNRDRRPVVGCVGHAFRSGAGSTGEFNGSSWELTLATCCIIFGV